MTNIKENIIIGTRLYAITDNDDLVLISNDGQRDYPITFNELKLVELGQAIY